MDFISLAGASAIVLLVTAAALFVALAIAMVSSFRATTVRVALTYSVAGVAAVVGIGVVGGSLFTQIVNDEIDARVQTIVDRYGWEPTTEQYGDLRYPVGEPEAGARDLYGHTDMTNSDGDTITVQLAWDGKKLVLLDMSDARELNLAD